MVTTREIVASLRKAGLSQTEIAKRTGIPQPRLSRWESGDVPTGADDALKLKALQEQVCVSDSAEGRPAA